MAMKKESFTVVEIIDGEFSILKLKKWNHNESGLQWFLLLLIWENLCSGRSNWTKPLHFDVKCDPCFESFQTSVIDHVKRDTRSYSTVSPDKARFVGEIDISNKNIYIQHYGEPNIIKFDNTFCFKLQFRTCFCVCFTKW